METKRRAVVAYENMSEELAAAFAEKYPRGTVDYLPDVQKITKPNGDSIYTVTVEIPSAIYLVKVPIKIDDTEDIDRWLESEDDSDNDSGENEDSQTLPDDNIAQYGSGEDDPADSDD